MTGKGLWSTRQNQEVSGVSAQITALHCSEPDERIGLDVLLYLPKF